MDRRQYVLAVAVFMVVATVMLSIPMMAEGQAGKDARRTCTTRSAVLSDGGQADLALKVTLQRSAGGARIEVHGSGAWPARIARTSGGAETITFDTTPARETITIGKGGEMAWEIDYSRPPAGAHVIGFVGSCKPWRS